MAKIDIIYQQSQQEQVLDIDQHRIIGLYEKLLNDETFWKLFSAMLFDKGYTPGTKIANGKHVFNACDPEVVQKEQRLPFHVDVHTQFEWSLIILCKRMLTLHHQRKVITLHELGREWSQDKELVPIVLTKQHLGILTKILKIENKRKAFLKKIKSKR